jgi:hypothetical protein
MNRLENTTSNFPLVSFVSDILIVNYIAELPFFPTTIHHVSLFDKEAKGPDA